MRRLLVIGLLALAVGGCAHDPIDPSSADPRGYDPTTHRADHPPWGSVAVREVSDKRPAFELGERRFLEESYASDSLFMRTVPPTLKRLIVHELARSGAFVAAKDAESADYLVDVEIVHFFTRSDRDVIGLIPIIPSIDIDCEIDLHLRLVDQDGRRFLDRRFERRDDALAATVTGVEATSARILYRALSALMEEFVVAADRSIPAFWNELGLPVP